MSGFLEKTAQNKRIKRPNCVLFCMFLHKIKDIWDKILKFYPIFPTPRLFRPPPFIKISKFIQPPRLFRPPVY